MRSIAQGSQPLAVIYDLDGTLLDTESLSTEAIQAVVGRFGATFTWCVASLRRRHVQRSGSTRSHSHSYTRHLGHHTQGDQEADSRHARGGMGPHRRRRYILYGRTWALSQEAKWSRHTDSVKFNHVRPTPTQTPQSWVWRVGWSPWRW